MTRLVVKWCGIDYGQTLMDHNTLHQSQVIPEVYRELDRSGEGELRLRRYYDLRDRVGGTDVPLPQRVRILKESHRPELYREVFDDDSRVIALYQQKEAEALTPPKGLGEALSYLKGKNIRLAVVSEALSPDTVGSIKRFLSVHRLDGLFEVLITPAGAYGRDGTVDRSFIGLTKKNGKIYDRLVEVLGERGIKPDEALMVGDDPQMDIAPAKARGMHAIQYTGVIDRGTSNADELIRTWEDVPKIL